MKHLRSTFASLRLHGPDHKGIVAACSHALDKFGCGIVKSETWTDRLEHLFFQRIVFDYSYENNSSFPNSSSDSANTASGDKFIDPGRKLEISNEMNRLKERFALNSLEVNWRSQPKKVALFVSKYDHCLVCYTRGT